MKKITGTTGLIALLASPAAHSISPALHNEAFAALDLDYRYLAFDVKAQDLESAVKGLRALGAVGWNLSMPHKKEMIKFLDDISYEAELIGAVNTVVHEKGRLKGYNTDGRGFIKALSVQGIDLKGKKITLSGSGGAGLSVVTSCISEGAEISVFNRTGKSFEAVRELTEKLPVKQMEQVRLFSAEDRAAFAQQLTESQLYINATPLGMEDNEDKSPIEDRSLLRKELIVCDLIYHPAKTKLLTMAEQAGCPTVNGKGMLLYQAAEAFLLWTKMEMPTEILEKF